MIKFTDRLIVLLLATFLSVGIDQATKAMAKTELMGKGRYSYLGDIVRLQYIENRGAFLSLGDSLGGTWGTIVLIILPVIALSLCVVYLFLSKKITRGTLVGISLIIGGGAGNLIDRILYDRSVIDFLNFGIGGLRTGIMNLADLFLTAGFVVLFIVSFKNEPKPKKEPQ